MIELGSIGAFLATFARLAAWMYTAPIVSELGSPKLRGIIPLLLAAAVAPLRPAVPIESFAAQLPLEIGAGLAVGMLAKTLFAGIEAGGQLIGLQLQLGFAGAFDPLLKEESLPTRRIAFVFGALALLGSGGVEHMLRFVLFPIHLPLGREALLAASLQSVGTVLMLAVRLAAPLLVAALAINLTLAIASKASPALNVFSVLLAGVVVGGAFVLWETAPAFISEIARAAMRAASLSPLGGWR